MTRLKFILTVFIGVLIFDREKGRKDNRSNHSCSKSGRWRRQRSDGEQQNDIKSRWKRFAI